MLVAEFTKRDSVSTEFSERQSIEAGFDPMKVSMVGGSSIKRTEITLLASAWEGEGRRYTQVVSVDGATKYSMIDLQPSDEQLEIFADKVLSFKTTNEDGVITVTAYGDKPTNDYVMQATVTEVKV